MTKRDQSQVEKLYEDQVTFYFSFGAFMYAYDSYSRL